MKSKPNFLTNQQLGQIVRQLQPILDHNKEEIKHEVKQLLQDQYSHIMNQFDTVLKEIMTYREEQTLGAYNDSQHEDRLTAIEAIHPHGRHAATS